MISSLLILLLTIFGEKGWLYLFILIVAVVLLLSIGLYAFLHWELTSDHTYHTKKH